MKKRIVFSFLIVFLLCQCTQNRKTATSARGFIMKSTVETTVDSLLSKHGEAQKDRITKGVNQTALLWKASDGNENEFRTYCMDHFISDTNELEKVFQRISDNFEVIFGYFNKITVDLQRPLHLDIGEILPVDESFGTYNPSVHFKDDFFTNKIAFLITLNFPYYTLEEKSTLSGAWTRKDWAYARLGDVFDSRLPAEANQQVVNASTKSDMYIADYNIFAGKLIDDANRTLFPPDMKLLSHWNIRDEIKTNYGKPDGIERQRMLYEVMKRIVAQEIPLQVINSKVYNWNPFTNKVFDNGKEIAATPEPSARYARILDFFHAQQEIDTYYPSLNTYLLRTFEKDMEVPLADLENLFTVYLSSPEIQKIASVIKNRLGRELEPFDIWYDGFKTRTSIPAETLDKATRAKYPDPAAVQKDLSQILIKLGWPKERALSIASLIQVDPARGSGHAWGAETRDQKSLLRTRIFPDGME